MMVVEVYVRTAASEIIHSPECLCALGARWTNWLRSVTAPACVESEVTSSRCLFEFLEPIFESVLIGSHFNNVAAQLPYHPLVPPA